MNVFLKVVFLSALIFSVNAEVVSALPAILDRRPETDQRQDILNKSNEILASLYRSEPQSRSSIARSYGYATFSNVGVKILFAGSGTGRGVAVNNSTGQKTFMNMAELQAGLGMGIKKFSLVWVFENENAFNHFVHSGWEIGAQASAAAKTKNAGGALQGAVPIAPGVWLYQLTEAGLALELTAKGTKYYKDNDLNASR